MAVEARFYVAEVTRRAYNANPTYGDVVLRAITRKTGDNAEWAQATPSGTLTMNVNGDALAVFDALLGKDVRLLITPVEEE